MRTSCQLAVAARADVSGELSTSFMTERPLWSATLLGSPLSASPVLGWTGLVELQERVVLASWALPLGVAAGPASQAARG